MVWKHSQIVVVEVVETNLNTIETNVKQTYSLLSIVINIPLLPLWTHFFFLELRAYNSCNFYTIYVLDQRPANFFCKGKDHNCLGFVGHIISVANTQLSHWNTKSIIGKLWYKNRLWTWFGFQPAILCGWIWAL
jgi:hypothetical protein